MSSEFNIFCLSFFLSFILLSCCCDGVIVFRVRLFCFFRCCLLIFVCGCSFVFTRFVINFSENKTDSLVSWLLCRRSCRRRRFGYSCSLLSLVLLMLVSVVVILVIVIVVVYSWLGRHSVWVASRSHAFNLALYIFARALCCLASEFFNRLHLQLYSKQSRSWRICNTTSRLSFCISSLYEV